MNLRELSQRAQGQGLAFLLIGGHAVIAHGYPRNTFDVDLLAPRSVGEDWRRFALASGYTVRREAPTFIQYNPPDAASPPLDVMLVADETFRQLEAAAVELPSLGSTTRVVCLRHLLALKCHAIRHSHVGRIEKDVDDVIHLVKANGIDVASPEWRELFVKYGPPELHEKLLRIQQSNCD